MGSTYFFSKYSDFQPKDIDYLDLIYTNEFKTKRIIRGQGNDIFQLKLKPKEALIKDALNEQVPMTFCKFLIPEFNRYIGFTIEDLPRVKPLVDKVDSKHYYAAMIYNAYIENGSFTLTEEQRLNAYINYKESRGK